jgi:hypothetical protein
MVIDFEENIGSGQGTVEIAGTHHGLGNDMTPSSCLGPPDSWTRQSCSLIQALASLCER